MFPQHWRIMTDSFQIWRGHSFASGCTKECCFFYIITPFNYFLSCSVCFLSSEQVKKAFYIEYIYIYIWSPPFVYWRLNRGRQERPRPAQTWIMVMSTWGQADASSKVTSRADGNMLPSAQLGSYLLLASDGNPCWEPYVELKVPCKKQHFFPQLIHLRIITVSPPLI